LRNAAETASDARHFFIIKLLLFKTNSTRVVFSGEKGKLFLGAVILVAK